MLGLGLVAARACGDEVVAHQSALDKCVPRELGVGHARVLPTTTPRRVSSRPVFWGLRGGVLPESTSPGFEPHVMWLTSAVVCAARGGGRPPTLGSWWVRSGSASAHLPHLVRVGVGVRGRVRVRVGVGLGLGIGLAAPLIEDGVEGGPVLGGQVVLPVADAA